MKKAIIGCLAVLLAASLIMIAACELGEIGGEETNVIFSTDAKGNLESVTLLLEGSVPATKASRALTRDMAIKGHDFFEVVFNQATTGTARASWEIGEAAGIRNVPRNGGGTTTSVDYGTANAGFTATAAIASGSAILFVGRKADKTLLAVGLLTNVDSAGTTTTVVTATSTSVTFSIQAITAGLPAPGTAAAAGQTFLTAAAAAETGLNVTPTATNTTIATATSQGFSFPAYKLPLEDTVITGDDVVGATYTLGGIGANHIAGIRAVAGVSGVFGTSHVKVPPRFPIGGGNSGGLQGPYATKLTASIQNIATTATLVADTAIPLVIPIRLIPGDVEGICSLTFELPVYAITTDTTGGLPASINWKIRPGFGTSAFDLDDGPTGKSLGGAILLAVGNVNLDYIEIITNFN